MLASYLAEERSSFPVVRWVDKEQKQPALRPFGVSNKHHCYYCICIVRIDASHCMGEKPQTVEPQRRQNGSERAVPTGPALMTFDQVRQKHLRLSGRAFPLSRFAAPHPLRLTSTKQQRSIV